MEKVSSFNVQIWCGLREGYEGPTHSLSEAEDICQEYVDDIKECVTVTKTTFLYVNGREPGIVVGFIRYPRYLNEHEKILGRAIDLGKILMEKLGQKRVTITTPQESIMLGEKE